MKPRHPFKFAPDIFLGMEVETQLETDESKSDSPVRTERFAVSSKVGFDELASSTTPPTITTQPHPNGSLPKDVPYLT